MISTLDSIVLAGSTELLDRVMVCMVTGLDGMGVFRGRLILINTN